MFSPVKDEAKLNPAHDRHINKTLNDVSPDYLNRLPKTLIAKVRPIYKLTNI